MKCSVRQLAAVAIACACAADAAAWGGYGHAVIARIAEQTMTPAARAKAALLLNGESMADVASWADAVRRDRKETAPLHYVNFAPDAAAPTAEELLDPKGNIHVGILGYADRLADASLSMEERAEALKFFVHFVGDLHQPLHCGHGDDSGGNRVRVLFRGEKYNLHSTWDSAMLGTQSASEEEMAARLLASANANDVARMASTFDVPAWIAESRAIVAERIYKLPEGNPEPELGDAYTTENLPVAEQRLLVAGVRLGALLNVILTNGKSPLPEPGVPFPLPPKEDLGPGPLYKEGEAGPTGE